MATSRLKDAVDSGSSGSPTTRLGAPLSPRGGPLSPRGMSGGLGAPWGAAAPASSATSPRPTRYSRQQLLDLYTGKEPVPAGLEEHGVIMREETIVPVNKRVTEAEKVRSCSCSCRSLSVVLVLLLLVLMVFN